MSFEEYRYKVMRPYSLTRIRRRLSPFVSVRKFLTGSETQCIAFHRWDDPGGATRVCVVCGFVSVTSHL